MYKTYVPIMLSSPALDEDAVLRRLRRIGAAGIFLAIARDTREADLFTDFEEELLRRLIPYFKQAGLEVVIWIGETIGHARSPLPKGSSPRFTPLRPPRVGDSTAFCPLDEEFISALERQMKRLGVLGADRIILDDDYRLEGGCLCPLHQKKIEEIMGEPIDPSIFYERVMHGGASRERDAYLRANGESLESLAARLRAALDTVSSKTRLGACTCNSVWDEDGTSPIALARIFAGETPPFIRLIGAPYWAASGVPLGDVIESERMSIAWCRESGIELLTEGDTYPRPRFMTPACYLECFDTALRAAGGSDGILKYMLDYVAHPEDEGGYMDAAEKNRPLYAMIDSLFCGKRKLGVYPYSPMHTFRDAELSGQPARLRFHRECHLQCAVRSSLATTYEEGGPMLLFGERARHVPRELLANGAVIDLPAARILLSRGIDVGINGEVLDSLPQGEGFSSVPVMHFMEEDRYVRLQDMAGYLPLAFDSRARVLTELVTEDAATPCICRYQNGDGERFVLLPFDAELAAVTSGFFDSYPMHRLLSREIDAMSAHPLPYHSLGQNPYLYPIVAEDAHSTVIGLWNLFADPAEPALSLRVTPREVRFHNCTGRYEDGCILLDAGIPAYSFAAVELLK